MATEILDGVDILDPQKKIVYVSGEALDFTFVPTRITLKGLRILDQMNTKQISEIDGIDKMIELISEQCSRENPNITVDWILDNTSVATIQKMAQDLAGVTSDEKMGETEKN